MRGIVIVLLCPMACLMLDAQSALSANTQRLACTVTLDRTEYLPGENIQASIDVVNPTAKRLEVLHPLRMGHFALYRKDGDGAPAGLEWKPMWEIGSTVSDDRTNNPMDGVVTMILQPGQRVQKRLSLSRDSESEPKHRAISILAPGDYRVAYSPCGTPADFRVVGIEALGVIAHAPDKCAGVVAAVLEVRGEFITVASDTEHNVCDDRREHDLNSAIRQPSPYSRIASGSAPLASLSISTEAGGESKIEMTDRTGRRQLFLHRIAGR